MRTVSGLMLAAAVGLAAGCGSNPPPPAAAPTDPGPPPAEPPAPAPTAGGWELDPAKHVIPTAPVAGNLAGAPFAPQVQVQGEALRFRARADGRDTVVELRLLEPGKTFEGLTLVVKPDQPAGPGVPVVLVTRPDAGAKDQPFHDTGYALTLEVGKADRGVVPGRVHLSLPGDARSYLAGTFRAARLRTPAEPPGPDDAPFVAGTITLAGAAAEPVVNVGYVRVDPYDPAALPVLDLIGTTLRPGSGPVRSDDNPPRGAVLLPPAVAGGPPRYEFLKLDPGRYWVFAAAPGGPAVGKWVTVAAGGQVTCDLALDLTKTGRLEVAVAGPAGSVAVVPADPGGTGWPGPLAASAAAVAGLTADLAATNKGDKPTAVTFPRLAPGKYEVFAGDLAGTAEVKVGETARVTLAKK